MQTITPCLWFDDQAEEAAEFYVSVFQRSRILSTLRYGEAGPGPTGSVMLVAFELDGTEVQALNGGPVFTFSEAISLVVTVQTQEEIDRLWEELTAGGGQPGQCGWLKDRYGLSWQIVPTGLDALAAEADPTRFERAMRAVLGMTKLDIAAIQAAAEG